MKITVSALGALKKYLPEEKVVELRDPPVSILELISDEFGVPPSTTRIGYVVNGQIQKQSYVPQPGDKIVFMIMGGAG